MIGYVPRTIALISKVGEQSSSMLVDGARAELADRHIILSFCALRGDDNCTYGKCSRAPAVSGMMAAYPGLAFFLAKHNL